MSLRLVEFRTLCVGDIFMFDEHETLVRYIKKSDQTANYTDGINTDFEVKEHEEVVIES